MMVQRSPPVAPQPKSGSEYCEADKKNTSTSHAALLIINRNSPASVTPFRSRSRQMRKVPKAASTEVMRLSLLLSSVFRPAPSQSVSAFNPFRRPAPSPLLPHVIAPQRCLAGARTGLSSGADQGSKGEPFHILAAATP
jgi:hypothetical protein